ncbi:MAG: alpha/beta fold hydrolase [Lautropia sp.]|nr:alpha/beta fold hydrolase [Lautropia sp.]
MSSQDHYTERTIRFGPDHCLIGTLSLPVSPPLTPSPGLILFNAGVLSRVGPHRLNVDLARHAALHGIPAIRFDLPGLGDSGFTRSNLPREAQELNAITAAMTQLASTPCSPTTFQIIGFCSGAELGLKIALKDTRVTGLTLIEPYYYPNALSRPLRIMRRLSEYGLRRAIPRIHEILRYRLKTQAGSEASNTLPNPGIAEESGTPPPRREAFTADLATLLKRGVHVNLIYASTLMGRFDFWMHKRQIFQPCLEHPHFRVELLPDTDHSFTQLSARQLLLQQITR